MPTYCGWSDGRAESPSSVEAAGMPLFSRNARSSASALPSVTPWPTITSGRRAASISRVASAMRSASGAGEGTQLRMEVIFSYRKGAVPHWASLVMSTTTGPGRPERAI